MNEWTDSWMNDLHVSLFVNSLYVFAFNNVLVYMYFVVVCSMQINLCYD